MNLNLLVLFLLAKLASCEIENGTSLIQEPENDGYMSPRFLYVPTNFDDYEEEDLEESLDDYEFYEYSGDYEDFEDKSLEERLAKYSGDYEDFEDESLANLEKNKSWIEQNSWTAYIIVPLSNFATFGLLWCICNKFCRPVGDVDPNDILMGVVVVVGADVAVAPQDFRKTVNAMSARGA
jgi:hypothetical protein